MGSNGLRVGFENIAECERSDFPHPHSGLITENESHPVSRCVFGLGDHSKDTLLLMVGKYAGLWHVETSFNPASPVYYYVSRLEEGQTMVETQRLCGFPSNPHLFSRM